MKYFYLVLIQILFAITFLFPQQISQYKYIKILKYDRLVFDRPSMKYSEAIGKAKPNQMFEILQVTGEFAKIKFNRKTGYLYNYKNSTLFKLIGTDSAEELNILLEKYNQDYSSKNLITERNNKIDVLSYPKSEFETQLMYENRKINTETQTKQIISEYEHKIAVDKARFNKEKNSIGEKIERLIEKSKQNTNVDFRIGTYNPDEEIFPIIINNTKEEKFVNVPIKIAKSFKEHKSQLIANGNTKLNWAAQWEYHDITITDKLTGNKYILSDKKTTSNITSKKAIISPPRLAVSVAFLDDSGNQILDASESAKIKVSIKNTGSGPAENLQVILSGKLDGKNVFQSNSIEIIEPGKSITLELGPIVASDNINTGKSNLKIEFLEENGFEPEPIYITITTQAAIPPDIKLVDFDIDDASKNGKIERGELTEIQFRIQNVGRGLGKSVSAKILLGENVFLSSASKLNHFIGNLKSGDYKDIQFSIYTNNRIKSDIPVSVVISEETGKFGYKHKLGLKINQQPKALNQIVFKGTENNLGVPTLSLFSVDIEKNIPLAKRKNNNAFAIVIGNRDYDNKDVPTVDFALRDAQYVKEYLIKTLGYRLENIIYYENATLSNIRTAIRRLSNLVDGGKSDVFVYYSGHGAPDVNTKKGYLMPVDCNPSYVRAGGYSLSDLYNELRYLKAKSTTVVIDACFSGNSAGGALLKNMSPVSITIDDDLRQNDNIVLFSSSGQDQISSWYPEKKHSLFTYYFLKALQGNADKNKDKILTINEISDYLNVKVPATARKLHNREQYPRLITNNRNQSLVKYDY